MCPPPLMSLAKECNCVWQTAEIFTESLIVWSKNVPSEWENCIVVVHLTIDCQWDFDSVCHFSHLSSPHLTNLDPMSAFKPHFRHYFKQGEDNVCKVWYNLTDSPVYFHCDLVCTLEIKQTPCRWDYVPTQKHITPGLNKLILRLKSPPTLFASSCKQTTWFVVEHLSNNCL